MQTALRNYSEAFIRLIYPAHCGACLAFLELEEENICGNCKTELARLPFAADQALASKRFEFLDDAWSVYPYESPVKEILSAIKFSRKKWLTGVFAEEIQNIAALMASETTYDAIIPVPLDGLRLMEREFNQAELMARNIAKKIQTPVRSGLLRKIARTGPQSSLGQKERQINLYGAFKVAKKLPGRNFLLVDDILTTGATAEEAARVLKKAGAARVDLLTAARTRLENS